MMLFHKGQNVKLEVWWQTMDNQTEYFYSQLYLLTAPTIWWLFKLK